MWYSVADTTNSFKWYGNNNPVAQLTGTGKLSITGTNITAANDLVVTNNVNGITRVYVNNNSTGSSGQADFGAQGSAGGAYFGLFTNSAATDTTVTTTAIQSNDMYAFGSGSTYRFGIFTNNTRRLTVTAAGSTVLGTGALTTTATDGFLYITTTAGVPTGVPSAATGRAALQIDSTNSDIYFYNAGWVRPVRSFSAGTTGFTPSSATTGAVTLAGTLNVANGGTGVTSSTGTVSVVLNTSPTFATSIDGGATFGAFASSTTLTIGSTGTTASTTNISTGAVAAAATKTINIGTGGAASSTTNINLGSANGGTVTSNAAVSAPSFNATSDARVKKNIRSLGYGLAEVMKMSGKKFEMESNGQTSIGVIAQEIKEVIPEVVAQNSEGMMSVNYPVLTAVLIEAVKELVQRVAALESK